MQGFQADMEIILQNLQMLEFDTPAMPQHPAGAVDSRDFTGTGKGQQLSSVLASASQARAFADDGLPPSHPSHPASVQTQGRRGVPAPTYPHKQPPRSQAFGQHPPMPSHGGLPNMGYNPQYLAQGPTSAGAKAPLGYGRRPPSSKGADPNGVERPQPFSQ